jgi:hypothetical protein
MIRTCREHPRKVTEGGAEVSAPVSTFLPRNVRRSRRYHQVVFVLVRNSRLRLSCSHFSFLRDAFPGWAALLLKSGLEELSPRAETLVLAKGKVADLQHKLTAHPLLTSYVNLFCFGPIHVGDFTVTAAQGVIEVSQICRSPFSFGVSATEFP